MPALVAGFVRDGSAVPLERVGALADALRPFGRGAAVATRRRGPSCWAWVESAGQRSSAGRVRLADGRILLFHGFIGHRDELASLLGLTAREATARIDSALFGEAWARYGENALVRARGQFSVVVWDHSASRLSAACSPISAPPLCFSVNRRRAIVATAPAHVLAWGDLPRRIDDAKLAGSLIQDYGDTRSTYCEGVSWLCPGELLEVTPGTRRLRRYYDLREHVELRGRAKTTRSSMSTPHCVEGTRAHLRDAVAGWMDAPGATAVLMSGGLDSTSVAVTALELLADDKPASRLTTFTAVPESGWVGSPPNGDESPRVRALAALHPALDARFVDSAGLGADYFLDPTLTLAEVPPRNMGNMHWIHECCRLAGAEGRRVMLEGGRGNATLSHDGFLRLATLLATGRATALLREAAALPRGRAGILSPMLHHAVLPMLRGWSRGRRGTWAHGWRNHSAVLPEFARAMRVDERAREDYRRRPVRGLTARRDAQLKMISNPYMQTDHRAVQLALQVLHGVELRDPLGERRFVEWCLKLPDDQYLDRGRSRLLARRSMRGRLPPEVLEARRRGVQSADWHLRLTRALPRIRDTLLEWRNDPAVAGRLDVARLLRLVDTWPARAPLSARDHPEYMLARVGVDRALATGKLIRRAEGGGA